MRQKQKTKKNSAFTAVIIILLLVLGYFYESGYIDAGFFDPYGSNSAYIGESPVEVHFIDTDQSDCTLVIAGDKTVLIDAGERNCKEVIGTYLDEHSVKKIDIFIATHPHSDHIGSGEYIINNYSVETLIIPDIPEESFPTTKIYENLLTAADENGTKLSFAVPGTEYDLENGVTLEILGPVSDYGDDYNNWSIVSKLTVGGTSFLFTGDMESSAEKDLLASGADVSCTVLKAGHHGSSTSSSDKFLDAAGPEYAVILCGKGNSYGHPHKEILSAFSERGYTVLRTDEDGSIIFRTDGENITVETER